MILRIFVSLTTLALLAISCNMTFEVGVEKVPTHTASMNVVPTMQAETPTSTATEAPPTKTATLSPSPTFTSTATREAPTETPTPTPLPGVAVIPISSLGTGIPWLPLDKTRWPAVHVVTFNTQLPPFDNPLVRQAFAASIDKEVIVEMARKYHAVDPSPATTFIPPQTLGRNLYGEVGINFDPEHAKELLTQAGYLDPASFPAVTFIVNSYGDIAPGARFNMAKAMAEIWRTNLGVTVEVKAFQPGPFRELITTNPPALFWVGWLPGDGNDPNYIIDVYQSGSEFNHGHFSSPEFDALVDRAATIHDPAARQQLYIEAERVLCEIEAGIIPLYTTFMNMQ